MNKTKIDWADMSWNPVTGCLHECDYCYARRIAERFGMPYMPNLDDPGMEGAAKYDGPAGMDTMLELEKPYIKGGRIQPYPYAFGPTFHRYRLGEPAKKTAPQTVFVCSMADLFGEWVPDRWIEEVFAACECAPQHRYLFLTKNPGRYTQFVEKGILPDADNFWYGSTATTPNESFWWSDKHNTFVSIEPIRASFDQPGEPVKKVDWIIIGAETGNRRGKVIPRSEWIDCIVKDCVATNTPVFMKDSLRDLMSDDFVQEYPW